MAEIDQAQMMRFAKRPLTIRELAEQTFEMRQHNILEKNSDGLPIPRMMQPSIRESAIRGSIPLASNEEIHEETHEEKEEEEEHMEVSVHFSTWNIAMGLALVLFLVAIFMLRE